MAKTIYNTLANARRRAEEWRREARRHEGLASGMGGNARVHADKAADLHAQADALLASVGLDEQGNVPVGTVSDDEWTCGVCSRVLDKCNCEVANG